MTYYFLNNTISKDAVYEFTIFQQNTKNVTDNCSEAKNLFFHSISFFHSFFFFSLSFKKKVSVPLGRKSGTLYSRTNCYSIVAYTYSIHTCMCMTPDARHICVCPIWGLICYVECLIMPTICKV